MASGLPYRSHPPEADSGYSGQVPLNIRYSVRAKRLRLVVRATGVELVVPAGIPEAQALAFWNEHRHWAAVKLEAMQAGLCRIGNGEWFAAGSTVPWEGRSVPLRVDETDGNRLRVSLEPGGVRVVLPKGAAMQRDAWICQGLYGFVKRWLPDKVAACIERQAPRWRLYPRQLRIKRMRTRWGSLGPHNDINLNWLLAFTPPSVLEYVVVHELCHIRHRNHSPEFWALVETHVPDWRDRRQWLKQHGGTLMQRFEPYP
jgi:predicted metal-dependent hydrolase